MGCVAKECLIVADDIRATQILPAKRATAFPSRRHLLMDFDALSNPALILRADLVRLQTVGSCPDPCKSLRDVEDLLAERGVVVSYETVRRRVNHFGPMIAADLRKRRLKPHTTWHLDEVYLKIDGRMVYLWRAVDAEGEVLDVLVQSKRNKLAALKLMRKLLKKYAFVPERLVTDDLRSYGDRGPGAWDRTPP